MKCPYCLSEVLDEASVCSNCTKDIYLFKSLVSQIEGLQHNLNEFPDRKALEAKIFELEAIIQELEPQKSQNNISQTVIEFGQFIVVPLLFLLLAHWSITMVFDAKLIYLRVISFVLPLTFSFMLFSEKRRSFFWWVVGSVLLAVASVSGMSFTTYLIDHTPVFPQDERDLQEMVEYALSIAFSFITGLLIGKVFYAHKFKARVKAYNPFLRILISTITKGNLSAEATNTLVINFKNYVSTIVAICSTVLSVYTGLKHLH